MRYETCETGEMCDISLLEYDVGDERLRGRRAGPAGRDRIYLRQVRRGGWLIGVAFGIGKTVWLDSPAPAGTA